MSRDQQVDSERYSAPANRDAFMVDRTDLMTFNTLGQEIAAKQVVGPNAPEGDAPKTYVVGTDGC